MGRTKVTVWSGNGHGRQDRAVPDLCPKGIHGALSAGIRGWSVASPVARPPSSGTCLIDPLHPLDPESELTA